MNNNGTINSNTNGSSQNQFGNIPNNSMNQPVYNTQNSMTNNFSQNQTNVDPMAAVANLNKEEAMEEALSHTNQYTPFEAPKQEVLETTKKESNKSAYILIGIIVVIMALFILFLPQISKMFGW